jgi:FixJ family two-component response regulator
VKNNSALTVAVVDDDKSFCQAMLRLLRAYGFRALAFASAEAFLADPDRLSFDCLLLDVQLGGLSGLQLQQQLKSSKAAAEIIFISAHGEPEYQAQAERAGCVAYLHKTASGASVVAAILQATS